MTAKMISVRQVRSGIGFPMRQKATLRSMGLGKIGRVRQFPDNPAVRGMIQSITHLVEIVTDVPAPGASPNTPREKRS